MQRIQVMLEDKMADALKSQAKKSGLSVSSYVRLMLNKNVNKKIISVMDEAALDVKNSTDDEVVTLGEFNKELNGMIDNAPEQQIDA